MKAPKLPKPDLPKLKLPAIDFKRLAEDFKTLDPKDPGMWPVLPRIIILAGMFVILILAAWWLGWRGQIEELDNKQQQELKFKEEWLDKKKQAINLEEHRRQLAEIDRSFGALLKQLPNKSEIEALLIDINQAGLGRGMQFDLFKPGAETIKGFYAELPITIKVVGSYHDLGAFAGDVAKMARIVTLNDIDISVSSAGKEGTQLNMSAVAKTFRYLDEEELAKQRKAAQGAEKAKGGKK